MYEKGEKGENEPGEGDCSPSPSRPEGLLRFAPAAAAVTHSPGLFPGSGEATFFVALFFHEHGSVLRRHEQRRYAVIPFRYHPELFVSPRLIGGEEAGAVLERPLIFLDIVLRQLTPVTVFVP